MVHMGKGSCCMGTNIYCGQLHSTKRVAAYHASGVDKSHPFGDLCLYIAEDANEGNAFTIRDVIARIGHSSKNCRFLTRAT